MTNNPLIVAGHSLSLHAPIAMWSDVLGGIDENLDDLPIPPHLVVDEGWTSDSDSDEIARGQVTPEIRAGLEPSQREMLANLENEVRKDTDPLNSVQLMARIATAVSFGCIALPLVLSTFAEAAKERDPRPFHDLYHSAHENLIDYRDQSARDRKSATPTFHHDEYGAMAMYIRSHGLEALTALTERDFFYNDERISTHILNAIIDDRLRICSIWDPNRGVNVAVSNRLINEVRGAMARMRPRLSDRTPDASDHTLGGACQTYTQRVTSFADMRLSLDTDAWTSSSTLLQAWQDVCAARSEPPGASSTFFKELTRWSGGRIQRSKKGKASHRVPGYSCIKLI
ncbi:hypothetical protein V1281_005489 [Nitrobacteraceae bacterium AZCC 2161]